MTTTSLIILNIILLAVVILLIIYVIYSQVNVNHLTQPLGVQGGSIERPSIFFGDDPFTGFSAKDGKISISTRGT